MNGNSEQRQFETSLVSEEREATRWRSPEIEQQDERPLALPERPRFSLRPQVRRARAALPERGGIVNALLFPLSVAFWMATAIVLAVFASGLEAD